MLKQAEILVQGMDCTHCCNTVQSALVALPGVKQADVLLAAEKALVRFDDAQVDVATMQKAIVGAGYQVVLADELAAQADARSDKALGAQGGAFTQAVLRLMGLVVGVVLLVVVAGEWLGLFDAVTDRIPWYIGWLLVLIGWYPILKNVVRATLRREVISHTLMSIGVVAALAVGQWTTAAIVVLFMRLGDYVESFTSERARHAVKDLTQLAPQVAIVERNGIEVEAPIHEVAVGDRVIVRPGGQIPVDGVVMAGHATINQAAITGESLPVDVGVGATVFAATIAQLGYLHVRTTRVGTDTTFGRVIKLVEEAESHRSDVQRIADRFSAYFLPVVAAIALLTFVLRRDPLATAAVLVVACSCSFALATPIAMLASIGAAAKRGLLIKGGKYLELLAKADVVLLDKTGTLTLGQPQITEVVALGGKSEQDVLTFAVAAEQYSEHPLAVAVRKAADVQGISLLAASEFVELPGLGVRAQVDGHSIVVGNARFASQNANASSPNVDAAMDDGMAHQLREAGKSLLYIWVDDELIGLLAAADVVRPEVPEAISQLRQLGIQHIELLTGDHERSASAIAEQLGIHYQANLLPEDKVSVVKKYQAQSKVVVMVGDGVNDAPALAQANVGIAMGATGTDIALETAHVALMRDDWRLMPEVFMIAQRTLRVVKMNLGFTTLYNAVGLLLAAFGILPPVLAAIAQSVPDLGILANSSRLLRQRDG